MIFASTEVKYLKDFVEKAHWYTIRITLWMFKPILENDPSSREIRPNRADVCFLDVQKYLESDKILEW